MATSPEPMSDKVGAMLQRGDTVLFVKAGYNHSFKWMVGKVIGFTDKMVKLAITELDLGDKPKMALSNRAPSSLLVTNDLQAASLEWLKEHMND